MNYTCWGFRELILELEARDVQLMGWEHEIAKSLAGLGETYEDLLNALLADIRETLGGLDNEQLPENIIDDGSIACTYDHDHSKGGCEFHD